MNRRTITTATVVRNREDGLTDGQGGHSASLDRRVEKADGIVTQTRGALGRAPCTLRRLLLPQRWQNYLIDGIETQLTTDDRQACDALRKSVAEHGWKFTEVALQASLAIPAAPPGMSEPTPCVVFTLRRDEHPLLPPAEPVTLQDHLDALREAVTEAHEGGESGIVETAERLLGAFNR